VQCILELFLYLLVRHALRTVWREIKPYGAKFGVCCRLCLRTNEDGWYKATRFSTGNIDGKRLPSVAKRSRPLSPADDVREMFHTDGRARLLPCVGRRDLALSAEELPCNDQHPEG